MDAPGSNHIEAQGNGEGSDWMGGIRRAVDDARKHTHRHGGHIGKDDHLRPGTLHGSTVGRIGHGDEDVGGSMGAWCRGPEAGRGTERRRGGSPERQTGDRKRQEHRSGEQQPERGAHLPKAERRVATGC